MPNDASADVVRPVWHGYALGLIGVTIFGLTFPATRRAVAEIDPAFIAFGRAVLAAVCAALALAVTRSKLPQRRHVWPLVRYGACVIIGFPILATVALKDAPAAHAGVIAALLPLATAMASYFVAGERPSTGFWLCGIAGTLTVLVYAWLHGAGSGGFQQSDILLLAAVACASWGYSEGAVISRDLGGWQTISWALVMASPVMLALILTFGGPFPTGASVAAWAGFAYVGIFSMFIGFFAWNKGLAIGGIAKIGQLQLLQTFVTLGGAWLLLGEPIGLLEFGFSGIVVALVAVGSRMRVQR
jgi:drug/metabolite transporter (DMT)-like permease